MAEVIVKGRKYRILVDATERLWNRLSFWTAAEDVEFESGDTLENNVGSIKGITTSKNVTEEGYAADASVVSAIYNDLRGTEYTIAANQTTLKITDDKINNDSIIKVYPSIFGAGPTNMVQNGNTVTITFAKRSSAYTVRVVIL
jgi:hypothetical protein